MRHENHGFGSTVESMLGNNRGFIVLSDCDYLNSWESSSDALIVGDLTLLERHVEVNTDEHSLSGEIQLVDGQLVKGTHSRLKETFYSGWLLCCN